MLTKNSYTIFFYMLRMVVLKQQYTALIKNNASRLNLENIYYYDAVTNLTVLENIYYYDAVTNLIVLENIY